MVSGTINGQRIMVSGTIYPDTIYRMETARRSSVANAKNLKYHATSARIPQDALIALL